jgi:hypothetical protein
MKVRVARPPICLAVPPLGDENDTSQTNVRGAKAMGKIVRVTVEGGVIQHVECPEGVQVIVKDYDTDGVDEESLQHDENGDSYIESIWE